MDQESEGTNLVIFVVGGGVLLLLLLLGGGAFFFLMARSEPMPPDEMMPAMEGPKVEVVEEGPIQVGPGPVEEVIRPKVAPLNKKPPETLPDEPKEKNQEPLPPPK